MNKLSENTVQLISSSYKISSIETLVKELVENSLDAKSTHILIYLKRFGLDKIDVIDDGSGISDASLVCQSHCTSKILHYSDIETVNTFGFRGEALSAICSISDLTITSNCDASASPIGRKWAFDKMGRIIAHSIASCKQGTTVSVSNIFHNLPVRCQIYKSLYILQKTLKLITHYLQQLYLSRKNIHIKLFNDNNIILNLPITSFRKDAISFVIGSNKFKYFSEISEFKSDQENNNDDNKIEMNLFIPHCIDDKIGLTCHDYKDSCYLFINDRPVEVPTLFKTVRNIYNRFTNTTSNRYPYVFLYLYIPSSWIDVNIDPDKRKANLSHMNLIIDFIDQHLQSLYDSLSNDQAPVSDNQSNIPIIPTVNENMSSSIVVPLASDNPSSSTNVFPSSDNLLRDNYLNSSCEMPPVKYIRRIHASKLDEMSDDLSNNKDDIFSVDESSIECRETVFNDERQEDYARGRLLEIEDHPIKNVNLKRSIQNKTTDNCEVLHSKKQKNTELSTMQSSPVKALIKNSVNESSKNLQLSLHLSLDSLEKQNVTQSDTSSTKKLIIVNCWDTFVISVEMQNSETLKSNEANDLVIFSQKDLIFASTYLENIANIQVPGTKLSCPIVINENHENLVTGLQKLPVQLIFNKNTGEQFHVISCSNFIKNGYRIHSITKDKVNYFEVLSKPIFIDEAVIFDEIDIILQTSITSSNIARTPSNRKWIYSSSKNTAELKLNNEIKKLTGKKRCEYFNSCLSNILKYRFGERLDEYLPELFRFCLNKC